MFIQFVHEIHEPSRLYLNTVTWSGGQLSCYKRLLASKPFTMLLRASWHASRNNINYKSNSLEFSEVRCKEETKAFKIQLAQGRSWSPVQNLFSVRATRWFCARYFSLELWRPSLWCKYTYTGSFATKEVILLGTARQHTAFLEATIWSNFIRNKRCTTEWRNRNSVKRNSELWGNEIQTMRFIFKETENFDASG